MASWRLPPPAASAQGSLRLPVGAAPTLIPDGFRARLGRQVCHRDTVLSPADSTIAPVPRHQKPITWTALASRQEPCIVPLATAGRQWAQRSLRVPVGAVPILIPDGFRARLGRQVCHRDTVLSPADSTIAPVPRHQKPITWTALASRQEPCIVALATPGRQWAQRSLRLPVGAAPTLIPDGFRARLGRQVCHRDTVPSPADSTIAPVPRNQEPVRSTPQASRHEWHRGACHPRQPAHKARFGCRWAPRPP